MGIQLVKRSGMKIIIVVVVVVVQDQGSSKVAVRRQCSRARKGTPNTF